MDPVYNTLMAVPAGLALVMLAVMVRRLARGETIHRYAWAVAYGALGFILTLLGAVMTLTWPLSGPVAFDNIAFGEPSLAFGVILIAGSVLISSFVETALIEFAAASPALPRAYLMGTETFNPYCCFCARS